MEEVVIKADHRQVVGKKVKVLRREGKLPAVVYGHNVGSIPISLDMKESSRTLDRLSPTALVVVEVDGEQHYALVRDKQRDPILGSILHVDFQAVSLDEKVRADLNVKFVGQAPAVETYLGIVVPSLEQVSIECLPKDLPDSIEVDISSLNDIGDSLLVQDLVVPDGVEILNDPEEVVVVIVAQAVEEEEEVEEVEVEEGLEPEVIERGKREEEEGETKEGVEQED